MLSCSRTLNVLILLDQQSIIFVYRFSESIIYIHHGTFQFLFLAFRSSQSIWIYSSRTHLTDKSCPAATKFLFWVKELFLCSLEVSVESLSYFLPDFPR